MQNNLNPLSRRSVKRSAWQLTTTKGSGLIGGCISLILLGCIILGILKAVLTQ